MEDLGPDLDCGESESQTDSETGNNIETKVSLQGEIKSKRWNGTTRVISSTIYDKNV